MLQIFEMKLKIKCLIALAWVEEEVKKKDCDRCSGV